MLYLCAGLSKLFSGLNVTRWDGCRRSDTQTDDWLLSQPNGRVVSS